MPPGEPVVSTDQDEETETYSTKSPKYEMAFKETDWFAEPILNFNPDSQNTYMEEVNSAVRYWRDIALELKAVNYPIAEGIDNCTQFDVAIRQKAQMLDDFLNLVISKNLNTDEHAFEKLRVLIAQGSPYLEFKEKMARVNFSLKCNTIWENDAVAYRCNTCALTPCMSLCEACFDANGHEGHDYMRFFSREGGACDCGNQDVIKLQGNCPDHGDESKRPKYDMSDVCLAEYIVTKLLVRLFLDYRGWMSRYKKAETAWIAENHFNFIQPLHPSFDLGSFTEQDAMRGNKIIEFLQECSNYGGPMRLIVSEVLLNKELYKSLTEKTGEHYDESGRVELSLDWRTSHNFMDDRESVLLPESMFIMFPTVDSLPGIECYSLLDELIFWIDRQMFPQNLINFGLSMLSEPGYRDAFAYRFFSWYPICGKMINDLCISQLVHLRGEEKVSPACSRVVHVTVQMLSSASLCKKLNEEVELIKTVFDVTRYLICRRLTDSQMSLKVLDIFVEQKRDMDRCANSHIEWKVMTMRNNAAISQHGYWFVMGDIQNVLTHTDLAVNSVLDNQCFAGSYMEMMSQMQGMNPIWRIVTGNAQEMDSGEDVQNDCRAYTLEFETLAVTLFNIVAAIQQENSIDGAIQFFSHVKNKLEDWFRHLHPVKPEDRDREWRKIQRAPAFAVSFHIPLHRHISTALSHFMEVDGFYKYIHRMLLRDETFVRLLLIHPLRIQVARSEINCGMWVRNGAQARMSSLIYAQWNVTSAFQTPDIDLIRFCAAHIDKEQFVIFLTQAFNISEKIRFRMGKLAKKLTAAVHLFQGEGWPVEEEDQGEQVSQEMKCRFNAYRDQIRMDPKYIETIMQNATGDIPEGSTFDRRKRDETIEEICYNRNATQMIIEFSPPPSSIVFPTFTNRAEMERERIHQARRDMNIDRLVDIVGERRGMEEGGPPNWDAPRQPFSFVPRIFEGESEPRQPVLRELEWIDPMFWGMFKLAAELIVVRVNSGASAEEHYRSEMVNCMAMGNMPYSKLRGSISEKGSRGSELIDKHFETILADIGEFVEPNENPNYLQQGRYRLKTSVWDSELCPVFFLMRAPSMKQAREVFAKMEQRERKNAMEKHKEGDLKMEESFWVPFRLINFDEKKRHEGISKIYNFLLTERFMLHCIAVLATGQDSPAKFHEATIQLAVYLLTLGVKYAQEYKGTDDIKKHLKDIFHTPFRLKMEYDVDSYDTVCSFMIKLFEKEARKKDALLPMYRNILRGDYDKDKVVGGRMIYLARFVTILSKLSPTCREIIQEKLETEEIQLSNLAIQEESIKKKLDPVKLAAKEAAKKRMAAIMQKTAEKNARTMEVLMVTEGMTADEVEKVDPSQQDRQLYDCPICGEQEVPNSIEQPFGMLAKLTTNFLCEEQIDRSCQPIRELIDHDRKYDYERPSPQMKTRRICTENRRRFDGSNSPPDVAKVKAPMVGTDLKTCGHAAHVVCFNAYRSSLYDGRNRPVDRREVGCPLCRFTVNIIVPLSFDKPYSSIKIPNSPLSHKDVWKVMHLMMKKAKEPVFPKDDLNVEYATIYSTRERGGLSELYLGRKNSADWAERQSTFENSTVSTLMVSLAVAMVERSSLLRTLGVPERRKTRGSLTEHIMTASVVTSKDVDFDVTMAAMTNLFAEVSEPVPSPERPSTSRESTPKPAEQVPGMSSDEMAAMTTKSSRKRSIDTQINIPLFILEPKATLVRMLAILIDNQSILKEMKQEIARNIINAVTGWVSTHTIMCLVLRLGEHKIRDFSNEQLRIIGFSDDQNEVVMNIVKELTSNQNYFDYMISNLETPDDELTDKEVCSTYQATVTDFLCFAAELLYHCKLSSSEIADSIRNKNISLAEALTLFGTDMSCLNPKRRAVYWTHKYRDVLGWMSQLNKIQQPFISEPLAWKPRRILRPPRSFEELFTRYFHRECAICTTSPSNPVICLLCGKLLCLDDCCRVNHQEAGSERVLSMSEIESHAERCSSSSGLFLSITSSMVLVMRGKQAAIWGTVYLDAHKEEDRNLKRGKPLYLCESRFKWLEYDWAEQEWQRVIQWINLSNPHAFINSIRECHLLPHH